MKEDYMDVRPFRLADLFQTYLPALMLVVLAALFVYNVGYFYLVDRRYLSILTVRDYYDGSLPIMILVLIFYNSLAIQFMEDPVSPYQRLIQKIRHAFAEYVRASAVIGDKLRQKLQLLSYRYEVWNCRWLMWKDSLAAKYEELRGKKRRKSKNAKYTNEIKGWQSRYDKAVYAYELSKERIKPDKHPILRALTGLCGWTAACVGGMALVYFGILLPFYGLVWFEHPALLFYGMLGFSLIILADIILRLIGKGEIWLLAVAGILGSLYFGMLGFQSDAAQQDVSVVDVSGTEYQMVRNVRRGSFVQKGNEVIFLPNAQTAKIEQRLAQ